MKTIEIIGDNYFGKYNRTRTACRSIIIKDNKILLSYEEKNNIYMIPGGGLESNETKEECVIRETKEETGFIIKPSECLLELNEYYENAKYVSCYFFGEIISTCDRHLTDREKEANMIPVWVDIDETINIFSKYEEYRNINEMNRGLYQREYIALKEILGK